MLRFVFIALVGLVVLPAGVVSADTSATVDPVFNFIKDKMVGRVFGAELSGVLAGTDVRYVWKSTSFISNLKRSSQGLSYDKIFIVKQTNFMPNPDGSTREVVADKVGTEQCQLRALLAPETPQGVMVGFCSATSNSHFDPIGSANSINLRLEGDKLVIRKVHAGAADCYANTPSGLRLCTSTAVETWAVVDGKSNMRVESSDYWVTELDAWTLESRGPASVRVSFEQ